jgi:hypothetical protein
MSAQSGLRGAVRFLVVVAGLAPVVGMSGCIAVGGTEKRLYPQPTLGQQLIDLKAARDCGAISPEQYDDARQQLLHPR